MANSISSNITIVLIGDNLSEQAVVDLAKMPLIDAEGGNTINFNPRPDSIVASIASGTATLVSTTLNKSTITFLFSAPFSGEVDVNISLLYQV